MVDRSVVDQVLARVRIEDVVSEYVQLRRRGSNFVGLCPFHKEKTPSFTVNSSKGIFKCFGCGKGGNALSFLMEIERLNFFDALRKLGAQCGIEITDKEDTPEAKAARSHRELLMGILSWAGDYYHRTLLQSQEGQEVGLRYFHDRGVSDEIIAQFQLGYAPLRGNQLTKAGLARGYLQADLVEVGLTGIGQSDGRPYDRFRGRVMFPIHSLSGRILGFGGRVLQEGEQMAKYLNSPESDIYQKSEVLFGLSHAKQTIVRNDRVVLVEGYMDVLSLHQRGVTHVVATCGTALTTQQASLLHRFCPRVDLLYDGDSAGIAAAERGVDVLVSEGVEVGVVLLPEGADPDDFVRDLTEEEITSYIKEHAQDLLHFKARDVLSGEQVSAIERARVGNSVLKTVALIPDGVVRSAYVYELSSLLNLSRDSLSEQLYVLRNKQMNQLMQRATREERFGESGLVEAEQTASSDGELIDQELPLMPAERDLLYYLLTYGAYGLYSPEEKEQMAANGAEEVDMEETVASFILGEMAGEGLSINNPQLRLLFDEYLAAYEAGENLNITYFTHSPKKEIAELAVTLSEEEYVLSRRWTQKKVPDHVASLEQERGMNLVEEEEEAALSHKAKNLRHAVEEAMLIYKARVLERRVYRVQARFANDTLTEEETMDLMAELEALLALRVEFATVLEREHL